MNNDLHQYLINFIQTLQENKDKDLQYLEEYIQGNHSVINSLIYNMNDNFNNIDYLNQGFNAIKIIYNYNQDIVIEQIQQNKMLPKLLVKYLTLNHKIWNENILFILTKSFEGNQFHHNLISIQLEEQKKLVFEILNYLSQIDNEELFQTFIMIIVEFWDNPQIAQYCLEHENIRFFQEYLLEYLNKSQNDPSKPLFFIEQILKIDKDFFYVNDFKILQEISIRQIYNSTEYIRQQYLRNINVLVYYGDKNNLLIDQINEVLEFTQITFQDHYSLRKTKQIIDNLKSKL